MFWQQWHDASVCVNMHTHIITTTWNSGKCFYAPVLTLASVWMPSIFNTLNHDDWPITAQDNEDDMD